MKPFKWIPSRKIYVRIIVFNRLQSSVIDAKWFQWNTVADNLEYSVKSLRCNWNVILVLDYVVVASLLLYDFRKIEAISAMRAMAFEFINPKMTLCAHIKICGNLILPLSFSECVEVNKFFFAMHLSGKAE